MFFHDGHEMLINAQRRAHGTKNNMRHHEKYVYGDAGVTSGADTFRDIDSRLIRE